LRVTSSPRLFRRITPGNRVPIQRPPPSVRFNIPRKAPVTPAIPLRPVLFEAKSQITTDRLIYENDLAVSVGTPNLLRDAVDDRKEPLPLESKFVNQPPVCLFRLLSLGDVPNGASKLRRTVLICKSGDRHLAGNKDPSLRRRVSSPLNLFVRVRSTTDNANLGSAVSDKVLKAAFDQLFFRRAENPAGFRISRADHVVRQRQR